MKSSFSLKSLCTLEDRILQVLSSSGEDALETWTSIMKDFSKEEKVLVDAHKRVANHLANQIRNINFKRPGGSRERRE